MVKPSYYWDACIFIEYLKREVVSPSKQLAVRKALSENAKQANVIRTSSVTHLEVLPKKIKENDILAEEKYWAMFGSKFFYEVPVDGAIIKLAREIKDFYFVEAYPKIGRAYRMMDTGDAIHLETAIIEDVDEFHTRDNKRRKGNVPLLDLHEFSPNGMVAGRFAMKIVSPDEPQLELLEGA